MIRKHSDQDQNDDGDIDKHDKGEEDGEKQYTRQLGRTVPSPIMTTHDDGSDDNTTDDYADKTKR